MNNIIKDIEKDVNKLSGLGHKKVHFFPDKNLPLFPELKQVKFPKSKKKRIISKWKKNKKNFKTVMVEKFLIIGNNILLREDTYFKLKEHYKQLQSMQ